MILEPSFALKIKTVIGGQPEEYNPYFEDWPPMTNAAD